MHSIAEIEPRKGERGELFGRPRPAMRGRYLIRNPRSVVLMSAIDALLALRYPRRVPPPVPARPRRILLADWTHLGNILFTLPTLRVLRAAFPEAEIGFLGGSWAPTVLEGTGLCDHFHFVDHFKLSRAAGGRLTKIRRYREMRGRAVAEMRALGYEVAIDVDAQFPPASPLFHAAGIPVRAGFTSGGFGPLLTHPVRWVHRPRPIPDYSRDLLLALWPELSLAPDALAPCYPGQPRMGPPPELAGEPYIVIHMGSGAPHREWPEEHWQAVARALAADGWRLVLAGSGARDAARIGRVVAALPAGAATILLDRPWPHYVAVVAAAAHIVCLESSSAHVAAAFAVPTTAIYPGQNELTQMSPWNARARVLTNPVGCAPCYRNQGCAAMACLRGITPEQVIAAVREGLGRRRPVLA